MKKFTALLSALALTFALCSCDKKTSDSESPTPEEPTSVSEDISPAEKPVGNASESAFRELTDEDFTNIEMKFTMSDNAPPVELGCTDLSGIDFGSRVSPCKTPENIETLIEALHSPDDEHTDEVRANIEEHYRTMCDAEAKGQITDIVKYDGKFFFAVNYDDLCYAHDSSLFRFDPDTGECTEVLTHTGLGYNSCFFGLSVCGNYLYYYDYNAPFDETLYQIEPNTFKETKLADFDLSINSILDCSPYICIAGLKQNGEGESYTTVRKMIDPVTGEEVEDPELSDFNTYYDPVPVLCDGKICEVTGGYSDDGYSTLSIKTQYYSLDTYISQYNSVFAWKDRVCVLVNQDRSLSESRLYTYDLNTMERTMVKMTGFNGMASKAGDGIVLSAQKSNWGLAENNFYYYIPELATAFLFDSASDTQVNADYTFLTIENNDFYLLIMTPYENAGQYGNYSSLGIPKKLYWFS